MRKSGCRLLLSTFLCRCLRSGLIAAQEKVTLGKSVLEKFVLNDSLEPNAEEVLEEVEKEAEKATWEASPKMPSEGAAAVYLKKKSLLGESVEAEENIPKDAEEERPSIAENLIEETASWFEDELAVEPFTPSGEQLEDSHAEGEDLLLRASGSEYRIAATNRLSATRRGMVLYQTGRFGLYQELAYLSSDFVSICS